jgi:mannose-6-phosphate isomerase
VDPRRLYLLRNPVQHYAWGSRTAIPDLLGAASPAVQPWAELWMGSHPRAPSQVLLAEGPVGLNTFIGEDPPAALGTSVAERFGGDLPFLFKVLAAESPLSIQAHPNAAQARAGFARENAMGIALDAHERCYRDPRHKPELICALTPFRALNRFREPEEIAARIDALAVPALSELAEPLRDGSGRDELRAFFEACMKLKPDARASLLATTVKAAAASTDPACEVLRELARCYPDDPGVLSPLFLNLVELAPGEAMFLPAGELHSYLSGTAIELMANSDNVLRCGLTEKHVDVPELLATLSFDAGPVRVLRAEPVGSCESRYDTPAEEFALSMLRMSTGDVWQAPEERSMEILFCTRGFASLSTRDSSLEIRSGEVAVAPAAARGYRVRGDGELFRASVGALGK